MADKLLITFGCSWTWGVGAGYEPNMSQDDYVKIAWDPDLADFFSFRGILSRRYDFRNLNFSVGGTSNQKQFRKACLFFSSPHFKKLRDTGQEILVLWGITSTARNEHSSVEKEKVVQSFLNQDDAYSKFIVKNCYESKHEIFELGTQMIHWNDFFSSIGIKNYWFDTFNHHDYAKNDPSLLSFKKNYQEVSGPKWPKWETVIDNKFDLDCEVAQEITDLSRFEFAEYIRTRPITNFAIDHTSSRDLASSLAKSLDYTGPLDQYHFSDWMPDNEKIIFLTKMNLLNPYSFHPNKKGHEMIANLLDPIFKEL